MKYIDKLNIPDSAFEFRTFEEKEQNWKDFLELLPLNVKIKCISSNIYKY